ncbi:hypothetical protein BAE44_0012045 [Dichanthelium oligosanthes]|uniref:Late embryogenesis abundant protein LEA-2 subgroup domain-containing protein n=1 Tax=Dichanthelium oligosanthes TaxID=888268 RepID=A0A1E5VP68_9POAL|nr:hypothetical protein BAE44_0012045 [Dichanthelium oligosanthes]
MAAAANGADDHELPLFHPSPPCAHYYVQSPSAASHSLSHPASESMALILSPFPNLHHDADDARHSRDGRDHDHEEASRLTLSRYSSSRGSNNSFPVGDKKPGRRRQVLRVVSGRSSGGDHGDEDDDADGEAAQGSGAWRYVKLDPEAPCCCIAFQVAWRVAASAALALLVFVLATRPRHPGVSFRVGKVQWFALGEGLDGSGVETSLLNCNSSVDMVIENHSKVFTLRVHPPLLQMSFGRFVFATSQARLVPSCSPCVLVHLLQGDDGGSHDVGPRGTSTVRLFVAAQEKPMYAAGRGMQDLLESSRGLPLTITVRARSRYRVVGSLVRLTYRHDSECVVLLRRTPDRSNGIAAAGRATCSATS